MTKEEILAKRIITFPSDDNQMTDDAIKRNVYAAMELYAKQEAIAFARFVMENSWQELNFGGDGRMWVSMDDYREYTDEEFYQLYLKSKSSPF